MQGTGAKISGPSVAAPGETITVQVQGGKEVAVVLPGHAKPSKLPVRDGKVDIKIPADLPPGSVISVLISDVIPPPGISVEVVSQD